MEGSLSNRFPQAAELSSVRANSERATLDGKGREKAKGDERVHSNPNILAVAHALNRRCVRLNRAYIPIILDVSALSPPGVCVMQRTAHTHTHMYMKGRGAFNAAEFLASEIAETCTRVQVGRPPGGYLFHLLRRPTRLQRHGAHISFTRLSCVNPGNTKYIRDSHPRRARSCRRSATTATATTRSAVKPLGAQGWRSGEG